MPTPFPSRQAAPTSWSGAAKTKPATHNSEWRCTRCDKLLGVCRDGRMHLRFAPDFVRVKGMDITDHFPAWNFAWSLWLNNHTIIKHRHHQGIHAAFQNVLKGGKNIVTGHTHRLQSIMYADYNGLRWGIEAGTVSEYSTESDKFAYAEDNPMNHCQGFMVLTFDKNGMLLEPEPCRVISGKAYFRGEVVQ